MPWAGSSMFSAFVADCITVTTEIRSWSGTPQNWRIALYDSLVTPDPGAARPGTYYGAGVWAGRELTGPGWGGPVSPGASATYGPGGDGIGISSPAGVSRAGVTLAGIAGDLMHYSATGRGACYHDYGGLTSVTGGALVITWPAEPAGCFRMSVT